MFLKCLVGDWSLSTNVNDDVPACTGVRCICRWFTSSPELLDLSEPLTVQFCPVASYLLCWRAARPGAGMWSTLSLRVGTTKAPLSAPQLCGISTVYNFTPPWREISAFSASDNLNVCERKLKTLRPQSLQIPEQLNFWLFCSTC